MEMNDRASDAETGLERERERESSIQADSSPNRAQLGKKRVADSQQQCFF